MLFENKRGLIQYYINIIEFVKIYVMDIFEIILGSYESFVIGVKFRYKCQVS